MSKTRVQKVRLDAREWMITNAMQCSVLSNSNKSAYDFDILHGFLVEARSSMPWFDDLFEQTFFIDLTPRLTRQRCRFSAMFEQFV